MRSHLAPNQPRPRLRSGARAFGYLAPLIFLITAANPVLKTLRGQSRDAAGHILIITGMNERYVEAARAMQASLQRSGTTCELIELPPPRDASAINAVAEKIKSGSTSIVAASGEQAVRFSMESLPEAKVVYFMIPNAMDADWVADPEKFGHRTAGISAEPAPEERLAWIRRVAPQTRRLALLYSARTQGAFRAITEAGKSRDIEIGGIRVERGKFGEALKALSASDYDGVVMIPDPLIYNAGTIQELLLWGLRGKKPVWAFSSNIVKAGAFAGQWCEPVDVGIAASRITQELLKGADAGKIGLAFSSDVKRAVNRNTAERIGLSIENRLDREVTIFGDAP